MTHARGRWLLLFVLPLLLAMALPGARNRSYRQHLPLRLLDRLAPANREIQVPVPVERFVPPLRPATSRLVTVHYGSVHPARAAARIGDETWIATPAGVLRFGSDLWTAPERARPRGRCDASTGLPAPAANDLRQLGDDSVELATDSGLVVVDRSCRRRFAPVLQDKRATALGAGLIGTWTGLVGRRSPSSEPLIADLSVTGLRSCDGSSAFVATHDRGLLLWHSQRALPVPGLERGRVAALSHCRAGAAGGPEILAAATAGLFRVRAGRATLVPGSPLHVTAVLELGADLLVGSFDDGLMLIRAGVRQRVALPGRVSLLHRGPGGAVLAASDRGLFIWRAGRSPVRVHVDGPPPGPITALAKDGETLWAGTFDAGLARLRGNHWQSVPVFDPRITSLHRDPAGNLWVGTASGLGRLRGAVPADGRAVDEADEVVRVADQRGWLRRHVASLRGSGDPNDPTLWVAVYPGLVVVDTSLDPPELEYLGARGQEADAGLPGPTIYAVAEGPDGLWVGSDDGLGRLALSGTRLLTDLGGVLPDNWVNDLRSEGSTLVVLTLRSGLLRLTRSGSQVFETRVMTSPGVLLLHEGRILFGSNASGLVVLEERDGRPPELRGYGPAQGLPSSMVTSLLHDAAQDRLWVGGSAGLTRVDRVSRSLQLRSVELKERRTHDE